MLLKTETLKRWINLLGNNEVEQVRNEMINSLPKPQPKGKDSTNYIHLPLDEIVHLYTVENWTMKAIADKYFVSDTLISKRLRELNVPIKRFPYKYILDDVDPEYVRKLYHDDFKTSKEVARILNCSFTTVLNFMRKHNIPIRDAHYVGKVYKKYG